MLSFVIESMIIILIFIRETNNLFLHYVFFTSNYGISTLVEMEWSRLNIPNVLRIFWAIRVLEQILYLLTDIEIKNETMYGAVKYLLIKGCDTFTAVLGMTSFVSYFCHYIGAFFQWVKTLITIFISIND